MTTSNLSALPARFPHQPQRLLDVLDIHTDVAGERGLG